MAANEAALMRPMPWALSDWMPFISKSTGRQGEWAIPPRNWKKSRICWAKAGIVQRVKDYEYSSWGEFDGTVEPVFQICDTRTVLNRIPFNDLEEGGNDPLDDEVQCLDNDNEKPHLRLSDDQVWQEITKIAGVSNSSSFQQLDKEKQRASLRKLLDMGASVRQLQRLTGLGRGIIQRV